MTAPPDPGHRPLGRNPAERDKRTLQLAEYLTGPVFNRDTPIEIPGTVKAPEKMNWGTLGNRDRNDCVPAALIHLQQMYSWLSWQQGVGNAPVSDAKALDNMALELYKAMADFDPNDLSTDRGASILQALKWWRNQSTAERDATQAPAPPAQAAPAPGQALVSAAQQVTQQPPTLKDFGLARMSTFAAWEPGNMEQLKGTIATLGGLLLGLRMPLTAQDRRVWWVPSGGPQNWGAPGSWQGHCVTAVGYNAECVQVVTWGGIQLVTWQFIATYCDEAFAVFSDDAPLRVFDGDGKASYVGRGDLQINEGPYKISIADAIHKDSERLALEAQWGTHANISH